MTEKPFPIVAIGASAGGVEALSALFKQLPAEPHAAFIVITHLAPNRESLLPEIIGRYTTMPVATARNGEAVAIDHVYLNPPDATLTLSGRRLALRARGAEHNPIDVLLLSLAKDAGEQAIAVILSGTGSDGAVGVKAVREAGGFTLAQGASDSRGHAEMPDAAIATGSVDCVLPVERMAHRITEFLDAAGTAGTMEGDEYGADMQDAKREICSLLQHRVGHDFTHYKCKTFFRRVERRMHVHGIADIAAYVRLIQIDAEEATFLFRDLLIGVTAFFRDPSAFDELAELVLPRLVEGKGLADSIRVWVPGCATGEEAYSIAILLCEALEKAEVHPRVQIFATDVDEHALAVARAGRYPATLLDGASAHRLSRFFVRDGGVYVVSKRIRELCTFSTHSIIRDPPFSQIDLISCRNLLIYFDTDLQGQVIPLFHYALRSGGYLFLGTAENVSRHADLFTPVDKKRRIFLRCDVPTRPAMSPHMFHLGERRALNTQAAQSRPGGPDIVRVLERSVLEQFAPAHVLVTHEGDALYFSARAHNYLEVPAGLPSRNLFAMVRKGLRLPLRQCLHQAREGRRRVQSGAVTFDGDGGLQAVDLTVQPLGDGGQDLWVVVFTEAPFVRPRDDAASLGAPPSDGDSAVLHLEQELQQTRERLQISVEDYETSTEELKSTNEELLSVNEELQSSNEELETSKEELQSVNEEVNTANIQLALKIDELDRSNNDIRNLFDSTRIATVFLDRHFTIRNFTPAMGDIFKLIPGDRGRPLSDIVSLVDCQGLEGDVAHMLTHPVPVEKNVSRRDGSAHYLMRIVPYLAGNRNVEGTIITFVNVTEMVRSEERQRLMIAELNHRVKNVLAIVAAMATQMARRCRTVQDFAEGFVGRIHSFAKTHEILSANEWSSVDLRQLLDGELAGFIGEGGRAALDGPSVPLQPRAATSLGIVFHELATNAMKYGALSVGGGRVAVSWRLERGDSGPCLVLTWREMGGPPVRPPDSKGLGGEMIHRCMDYELSGTAAVDYPPEGIVATLTMPMTADNVRIER